MKYIVAIYDGEGLRTWEGFGPGSFQAACRQTAAYAREGVRVILFELEGVEDMQHDSLYDWLDTELTLAPDGLHDPRLSVFVEYPAAKEAS